MGVTNRLTSNPPFFGYGSVSLISDQLSPSTAFLLNPNSSLPRPSPISSIAIHLGSLRDYHFGQLVSILHHAVRPGMELQFAKAVPR